MIVRFTKSRSADRPHTFTCVRDDGTVTGQRTTDFFVQHDLTHFAIEKTLGLTEAFYGLLAQGWDLASFEEREPGSKKVRQMPAEAGLAEMLAGSFDLEHAAGEVPHSYRLESLGELGAGITEDALERVRTLREELFAKWRDLAPGESLDLSFERVA